MINLIGHDDLGKEVRFNLSQIKSLSWRKRYMSIESGEYEVIDPATVECSDCEALREQVADYEESAKSRDALVRQLDVIWNGEQAATQASLCDMVSQLSVEVQRLREQAKVLRETLEWLDNEMDCRDDEFGGCLFSRQDFGIVREALEQTKPKDEREVKL